MFVKNKGFALSIFLGIVCTFFFFQDSTAQSKFSCSKWATLDSMMKPVLIGVVMHMNTDSNKVTFKHTSAFYAAELDTVVAHYQKTNNQDALNSSLGIAFRTIAVMEGDWGNGQGKVDCAKAWMGEKLFEEFKTHNPKKYLHLVELDAK
jgi:hypothetical protein